jgi:hypothetical protein
MPKAKATRSTAKAPQAKAAFKKGDKVTWDASQGAVTGIVERTVTKTTRVKGHVAKATPEHPEVLVKSAKTGAEAVHRPSELRRT